MTGGRLTDEEARDIAYIADALKNNTHRDIGRGRLHALLTCALETMCGPDKDKVISLMDPETIGWWDLEA